MSKQAQVGLFTLAGLVAIVAVFYVLADLGTRTNGYKIGVHFPSATGLHRAAVVYLSGVPVGAVDDVVLEPDYTVDVIIAIKKGYDIPKNSRYLIQAPLTGEPNVLIEPPRQVGASAEKLPQEVLPLDQQPQGANPTSLADLLEEGQGEIRRVDRIMAQVETRTPALLAQLDATLKNANSLTNDAKNSLQQLTGQMNQVATALNGTVNRAGQNVEALTSSLNKTVARNSGQVDMLLTQLNRTTRSFGETADSLRDVAKDPNLRRQLLGTVDSFSRTARTFALISTDLRQVTGNVQTQSDLRDTVAHIDATAQKVDSILASFGGTSSVYGVDKNATPAPAGGAPAPGAPSGTVPPPGPGAPAPGTSARPGSISASTAANFKKRFGQFTRDLYQLEVRVSQVSTQRPGSANRNTSPLLTSDRGPQSDFNLRLLPKGSTSVLLGFNDIGANGTANAVLLNRKGDLQYGGGVLYSRLGLMASVPAGTHAGFDIRAYDLRHPTVDAYANLFLAPKLQLFGGERDLSHASRRAVFGLQFEL